LFPKAGIRRRPARKIPEFRTFCGILPGIVFLKAGIRFLAIRRQARAAERSESPVFPAKTKGGNYDQKILFFRGIYE
jgi:hypothetical protein